MVSHCSGCRSLLVVIPFAKHFEVQTKQVHGTMEVRGADRESSGSGKSMSVISIEGGNPLIGSVEIPGSKNAALAVLSAVLLADGVTTITKVPALTDMDVKLELLRMFGAKVSRQADEVTIDARDLCNVSPDERVVRSIRTSFYMLGPLLARNKRVTMPAPGGCKIGARPVDYHLKSLEAMGAKIDLVEGNYIAEADRLVGANLFFDFPSAGATQHMMATASLAEGITTISNAAIEPEVVALADFLTRMGVRIEGAGSDKITIFGRERLDGTSYRVPADRMQAGTYLIGGAITGGDVTVQGVMPEDLNALCTKLEEAEVSVEVGHDYIRASAPNRLEAVKLRTMPHPGFPTDLQQPMTALLTLANGTSVIEELVYESRIGHVNQLVRMGADITVNAGRVIVINGVDKLSGAIVEASDLRAGASLVLAGLAAEGETTVRNVEFIDRGYERLEELLGSLGAKIERVSDTANNREVTN